jgi:hypothetical protein
MSGRLRAVADPFVVAAPAGARIRTRLKVTAGDEAVLRAVGSHLGSLAGHDLQARVREGRLDAKARAASRRERKRDLTPQSSSRWAGSVTRATEDQVQLAVRCLAAEVKSLRSRARRIEARLAVPAGTRAGRTRGYATQAERYQKQRRLQALKARQNQAERQLAEGQVAVVRGGKRLLGTRHNLADAGLTEARWRERWDAARLFITADGEKDKHLGNETIRWHPDEQRVELKLPAPLANLANQPHGRYRLSCQARFSYRGDEAAAQARSGAIRYDVRLDPAKGRWYLDASWKTDPVPDVPLQELRQSPVLAVDLNHGFLAAWVITPDGNPAGEPLTVPLQVSGLPAAQRDGRVRAAVSALTAIAQARGCRAVAIENLNFTEARTDGREQSGGRPSRGRRGRSFRRIVAGLPTARFRDRLAQMTRNKGLAVIAADPAYTSRWGREHWLAPLRQQDPDTSGHHAAAVVIGRRAQGHKARRRAGVTPPRPEDRGAGATPRVTAGKRATREGETRKAARQPPRRQQTGPAERGQPPDQAAQDRSGPPDSRELSPAISLRNGSPRTRRIGTFRASTRSRRASQEGLPSPASRTGCR